VGCGFIVIFLPHPPILGGSSPVVFDVKVLILGNKNLDYLVKVMLSMI
jgi:hypothetical protein